MIQNAECGQFSGYVKEDADMAKEALQLWNVQPIASW